MMTLINCCCIKPGYEGLVLTQAKGMEDMGEVDTMVPYYKRIRVPYREQKKREEQEGRREKWTTHSCLLATPHEVATSHSAAVQPSQWLLYSLVLLLLL